jgi:hypothetical protein
VAEPLSEDALTAIVAQEIASSIAYDKTEIAEKRRRAIEYMRGEMSEWPAEKGRSSVVSRDTSDVVSWILPAVIRLFSASGQMAICDPVEPSDEAWADQATAGINHAFWKDNNGYKLLYDATYNSLLHGNGIVKHWWDKTPKVKVSFHSGLSDEQLTALLTPEYEITGEDGEEEKIELLAQTTKLMTVPGEPDPQTGQPGQQMQVAVHEVKISRTSKCGRIAMDTIAPENFLLSAEATSIENARMKGHKERKTRSDLLEMGFDRGKVMSINRDPLDDATDRVRREATIMEASAGAATMATEIVTLYELYLKIDVDGDDIAETCRIFYAGEAGGGVILEWEVWEDEEVFTDIPCEPVPHRWEARSVFDKTQDVQEVKTALVRQALDNTYATNNPQRFAKGRFTNPDELVNPSFGGVVFGEGDAEVTPLAIPFVADKAFAALEFFDNVIEKRTGVSRTTMALDPEALQNQTATASQLAHDAAYSQTELVGRNQAEYGGWKKVFKSILKLMVRHQDRPRMIRLEGKKGAEAWRTLDPRYWNADMDVTINTGLGTGSRDRDIAHLAAVKADQMMIAAAFREAGMLDKAIGMIPMMLQTAKKSAEAAGIKSPEIFLPEISEQDVQQAVQNMAANAGKPDPATQAKIQADQQKAQSDAQIKAVAAQNDIMLQREKIQGELQLRREQLAAELQLRREQMAAELMMKERVEMARLSMGFMPSMGDATTQVRPGGQPG